jgi:hypothetical protein
MGSKSKPWGDTPIKDQSQAEFEAHHRENQARAAREAADQAREQAKRGSR